MLASELKLNPEKNNALAAHNAPDSHMLWKGVLEKVEVLTGRASSSPAPFMLHALKLNAGGRPLHVEG